MPARSFESLYQERYPVCSKCAEWRGSCSLGHRIDSTFGCPLKKFQPVGQAPYLEPKKNDQLTWPRVLALFGSSMVAWFKTGAKLVGADVHYARHEKCKTCPRYRDFICLDCGCLVYIKAKLAPNGCPQKRWEQ